MNRWLDNHREEILSLAAKHGARKVRVFGSMARDEAREDSDVDLLVEFEPGRSLFDQAGLLLDLRETLHREFDIATEQSLHWFIRDQILKEAKLL
jgi:predicted nucleotidyltransferase